ncbi:hypothetical protein ACGFNU_33770 [Spirillospora sp. NPDC048911]|uniref:hypothetical protein n=1 Tax=Spirillospora sp. NPDC048911 TaxID=3364527 RepID=UPI00371BB320
MTVVLVVAGLAVIGGVRSAFRNEKPKPSATTKQAAEFVTGGCVRVRVQPSPMHTTPQGKVMYTRAEYAPVQCDDPAAYARITKMGKGTGVPEILGDQALEKLGCPIDTDDFVQLRFRSLPGDMACMRRFKAPHPGDPGQGGGLVRAGDCIQVYARYSDNLSEVSCTNEDWIVNGTNFGKRWFGQVVRRVDAARECPKPAIYSITVRTGKPRVLCLAKNGGWMPAVGDCVDGGTLYAGVNGRRKCDDKYLAVKITALVKPGSRCPGDARTQRVPGYLLRMCVRSID